MNDLSATTPTETAEAADETDRETRAYLEVLRRNNRWPDGVHDVKIRYGDDWTGAPAVWVVLVVDDDLNPSKEKIAALMQYLDKVTTEFHQTGSNRYPYFSIDVE